MKAYNIAEAATLHRQLKIIEGCKDSKRYLHRVPGVAAVTLRAGETTLEINVLPSIFWSILEQEETRIRTSLTQMGVEL